MNSTVSIGDHVQHTGKESKAIHTGCVVDIIHGDCIERMRELPDNSIDSIVTDPPYGLSPHSTEEVAACLSAWLKGDLYIPKKTKKGFMGRSWDAWVPGPEVWREALRVLKPGGHALIFAGTRSMDLMMMAVRLAGFEIRDSIGSAHDGGNVDQPGLMAWVYGSGFPKSLDVSKSIDKMLGAEREVVGRRKHPTLIDQEKVAEFAGAAHGDNSWNREWDITAPATSEAEKWSGWGTSLKPAWEPIIIARKPLDGTVAENILKHGVGGINIDACRVPIDADADATQLRTMNRSKRDADDGWGMSSVSGDSPQVVREDGRFPANVIHDGSGGVLSGFPLAPGQIAKSSTSDTQRTGQNCYGEMARGSNGQVPRKDAGSAARFFYCAKASPSERHAGLDRRGHQFKHGSTLRTIENGNVEKHGNHHPTVKPVALLRYLLRLITPQGGVYLDIFAGSGSLGVAGIEEGFDGILIEQEKDFVEIAKARVRAAYQAVEKGERDVA